MQGKLSLAFGFHRLRRIKDAAAGTKFVATKTWMLDLGTGKKSENNGKLEPYTSLTVKAGDEIAAEMNNKGLIEF